MKYINLRKFSLFLFSLLIVFLFISSINGALIFASDRGDKLKVTFLDIGQGDCEIIRTPSGKIIMIDAGDDRANAADGAILPYFAANGIKKIDILIMSHAHRDHIGGLLALIPKIEIGAVYENRVSSTQMYAEILKLLKAKNIPVYKIWKDDKIDLGDGIEAAVLHPPKEWKTLPDMGKPKNSRSSLDNMKVGDLTSYSFVKSMSKEDTGSVVIESAGDNNLNDFSIVLRMQYKNMVYQFGGDAEAPAEDEILATVPEKMIKTYVYKVCHHGSATSSTPAYLAKLRPEVSVISCGVNNQFKHPVPSTLKNLEYFSKVIYRTDIDKTIESWSDGTAINFSTGSTPNSMPISPKTTDITPYSATIEWETTQLSTARVKYWADGDTAKMEKARDGYSLNHKITITGLKPNTPYNFEVESVSQKDLSQLVKDSGYFRTAADPAVAVPEVSLSTVPEKLFVYEPVKAIVKISQAPSDAQITLYEDAVSEANKLAATSGTLDNGQAAFDWTPKSGKVFELFAVIRSVQKVIAVVSFKLTPGRRLVMIDEAHENLGRGYFEDLKINLFNNGLQTVSNTSRISDETLKNASVLIISEYATTEAGLNKDEIAAVKNFVDAGGGLLLIGRCDYKGLANPQTLNRVLEQTGSNIRINDDEVLDPTNCTGSMKWVLLANCFDRKIIPADVRAALFSGTASMLNSNMAPITSADKTVIQLAYGDGDCTNIDADASGDAVIYPDGVPVVIEAAEIMPSGGKIAVFGSQHFGTAVYTFTSQHQTPDYNFSVIKWLSHTAKKGVEELSDEITSMPAARNGASSRKQSAASETAAIGAAIRADEVFNNLEKEFDPASPKLEESLDRLIKHVKTDKVSAANETAAVIKTVLDRVRYGAAQNPELMNRIKPRIEVLEEHYQKLIK